MRYHHLVLVVAVYCIFLSISKDIDYYIHPRYELFTVIMSGIGMLLIGTYSILGTRNHTDHTKHDHYRDSYLSMLPLIVLVSAALLFPARSLQAVTVSQRATDAQSASGADTRPKRVLFSGSSRGLSIVDWAQLLMTQTDEAYYTNKPAKISGFLYDADLGTDTMWVARFAVTCCAVDARPVGIPVRIEKWQEGYGQDQWVEVEGTFRTQHTAKGMQLVLVPDRIDVVEEPQNPYVN